MTEIEGVAPAPRGKDSSGRFRFSLLAVCALVGGAIGGAGGFAVASAPWHHRHGLEGLQFGLVRALDSVGATSAQESKIHDIVATAAVGMERDTGAWRDARKRMLDLLRAPSIDQAAVERLRAEQVVALDERSKAVLGAVVEAAEQLNPEQRAKLVDRLQAMMDHHGAMRKGEQGWDRSGPFGHDPDPIDGAPGRGNEPDRGADKG